MSKRVSAFVSYYTTCVRLRLRLDSSSACNLSSAFDVPLYISDGHDCNVRVNVNERGGVRKRRRDHRSLSFPLFGDVFAESRRSRTVDKTSPCSASAALYRTRGLRTELGDRSLARLELRALTRDRLLLRGRRGFQGLDLLRLLAELAVPLLGGGEVLAAAEAVNSESCEIMRASFSILYCTKP